jgi:hypothetical protein
LNYFNVFLIIFYLRGGDLKKVSSIFITIMLLVLTSCSSKDVMNYNYTYKGENELWSVEYKVNGTGIFSEKNGATGYKNDINRKLTVTYKKDLDQLSSEKKLQVWYESSADRGNMVHEFKDGKPVEKTYIVISDGKNGAIENKHEIIKVTIWLDEQEQVIELKNKN